MRAKAAKKQPLWYLFREFEGKDALIGDKGATFSIEWEERCSNGRQRSIFFNRVGGKML